MCLQWLGLPPPPPPPAKIFSAWTLSSSDIVWLGHCPGYHHPCWQKNFQLRLCPAQTLSGLPPPPPAGKIFSAWTLSGLDIVQLRHCLAWTLSGLPPPLLVKDFSAQTLSGSDIVQLRHLGYPPPLLAKKFSAWTLSGSDMVRLRLCLGYPLPAKKIFSLDIIQLRHCPTWTLSNLDIVQVTPPPLQKIFNWDIS